MRGASGSVNCSFCNVLVKQVFALTSELSGGGIRTRKLARRHGGMSHEWRTRLFTGYKCAIVEHFPCFSSLVELNFLPCCQSKRTLCREGAANYIPRVCVQLKKTNLLPHSSAHNLHGSIEHHLHTNRPAHKPAKQASVTRVDPYYYTQTKPLLCVTFSPFLCTRPVNRFLY